MPTNPKPTPSGAPVIDGSKGPTVNVAEAMGLPENWAEGGVAGALGATKGKGDPTKLDEYVETPEPAAGEEKPTGETPAEGEEKPEGGEKPAGEKAAEEKPGAAAKDPKTGKFVKAGEKPAGEKKAAPAGEKKPVVKATEKPAGEGEKPAGEKSIVPAKVKVGDKEYTPEELQALIAKANAAKPAAPEEKSEPEKKEPTAEEVAAQKADTKKKDSEWIAKLAPELDVPVSEEVVEKILQGGKEGVAAVQALLQETTARAILLTRKSMFADIQPVLDDLRSRQEPLISAQMEAADEKEWSTFAGKYPELVEHRELVEQAAQTLVEKQAAQVRDLSMEQFQDRVAGEVKTFLAKFGKGTEVKVKVGDKEYTQAEIEEIIKKQAGGGGGGEGEKPAAGAEVKPKAGDKAKVKPPGANVPEGTIPGKGDKGKSGDSAIIAGLW